MNVRTHSAQIPLGRRGRLFLAPFIVAALAGTLSCGGDGTTDPAPPPPPPPPPVATSLTVSPATAELDAFGATAQLSVEVLDQNGRPMPGATVAWSSGDESVATVDGSGLVTAVGNGEAAITAASGSVSGSATVTVAQVATAVAVSPASASLEVGDTLRLSAEATDANGHAVAGAAFSWSSDDESVTTVDGAGLVTAVAEGEAAVTATSGSASGSAAVSVSPPPVPPEPVGAMPDQTLEAGQATTVDASEYFSDPDGGDLAYTAASSDSAVATVEVSGAEVVITGAGPGTATVTVTATDPDGLSAEQSFGVVVSGSVEDDFESEASLNDWEAANADVAVADGALAITNRTENRLGLAKRRDMPAVNEWTIQARMGRTGRKARPGVVSLTGHGRFTAVRLVLRALDEDDDDRGRAADEAATRNYEFAVFDGGAGEWVLLTNLSGNSESIAEEPGEFTDIEFGHEAGDFVAYAGGSGAAEQLFRVDLAEARVDEVPLGDIVSDVTGLWMANQGPAGSTALHDRARVTGSGSDATPPDEAEIEDAPDDATRTSAVALPVVSVTVTPAVDTLAIGDTLRLSAAAYDADGRVVAGAEFSWSSSDEAVATVDASGLLTAVAGGLATITATAGDVSGSAEVAVKSPGNSSDRAVLVALYEATDGPKWKNSENWLTDAPLGDWYGVDTNVSGRVVSLDLSGHPGEPNIPHGLSGRIPPELGELTSLASLNLRVNELTGEIPSEIGGLQDLEVLELWANDLSGPIPPGLGGLRRLKVLALDQNALTGLIPPDLGDLANLESLWLGENDLTGPIPPELGKLTTLDTLALASAGLSGPIPPELGGLTNLTYLNVAGNDLAGQLPASFLNLALEVFYWLQRNGSLCAPDTSDFRAWLAVIEIHLPGPFCWDGSRDRTALTALYEATGGPSWNESENWLTDTPLGVWTGVTTDHQGRVVRLDLGGNNLRGEIPPEFGDLAGLTDLRLEQNELTGPIPPGLRNLTNLKRLRLDGNKLTGPIPAELGNLANLTHLYLAQNELAGPIPPRLGDLAKLTDLYLGQNELTGPIPLELGDLVNLTHLGLNHNKLSGPIPPELGRLASLRWLSLNYNSLTGPIPVELADPANLTQLNLGANDLTGPIPSELGDLANLQALRVHDNRFTGPIPPELGNLANMEILGLGHNDLTGSIPAELGDLANLTWLSLTSNGLTGPVPPELGDLASLEDIRIDNNSLTGGLPDSFLRLSVRRFWWANNAGLCAPDTEAFRTWVAGIEDHRPGPLCAGGADEGRTTRTVVRWIDPTVGMLRYDRLRGALPPQLYAVEPTTEGGME